MDFLKISGHGLKAVFAAAVLGVLASGCGDAQNHFDRGRALVSDGRLAEARSEFVLSLLEQESVLDSHVELARIYEKNAGNMLLALWHYRAALKAAAEAGTARADLQKAAEQCQEKVCADVKSAFFEQELGTLKAKIHILEEHAGKLKEWLDEERNENRRYRRLLEERVN